MTPWKLAFSYFVPTCVFFTLLCSAVFSQIGLLEKWVFGDNEIRQIVSPPPVHTRIQDGNDLKIVDEAGMWSNNGYHTGDEDSLRTARLTAKVCFNQAAFSSLKKITKK